MLYGLTPVGIGTAQVEALTSYVSRLAAAHLVSSRRLLRFMSSRAGKFPSALNGTCASAVALVAAIERHTGFGRLDRLTLLPWKAVLSSTNSLAKLQRWCPACLNEWQARGIPAHYPLGWCLSTVHWCSQHERPLSSQCPACCSAVDLLDVPGRCGTCFVWLGDANVLQFESDLDNGAKAWFATATARLIADGQADSAVLAADGLRSFVGGLFDAVSVGHMDEFRRRMGLPGDMLYRWRDGRSLPSLEMFLTFCARLNVDPDDVLDGNAKHLNEMVRGVAPGRTLRAGSRAANRRRDWQLIRRALAGALAADLDAAPPLSQVARDLEVSYQLLRYHFGALAKAVCLRHGLKRRMHRGAKPL